MAKTQRIQPAVKSAQQAPAPASPPPGWGTARATALGCILLLLICIALVAQILHRGHVVAHGNETTWDRSIFTAINTATLTGFQQTMGVREMSEAGSQGPILLFALTILGSLTTLTIGGIAAMRVLRKPHTVGQIIWAAVSCVLLTTLGGAAALAGSSESIFHALFQATCAFGNSGLWLGHFPSITMPQTFLVLLPLTVLGGLGLPVLIELSDRLFGGPPLSRYSRLVLALTSFFYLGGTLALVLAQIPAAWNGGWSAWRLTLASSSIAAINTRSAGLPFQSPAAFTAAGQWIMMLLMLIGASSAGTASGLKMTTLWQLGRGIRDIFRGRLPHRITGIAAIWLLAFLTVLLVGILALSSTDPQIAPDRLLFLACSALGNVGLWHDPVSITGPGLIILSFLMLAGRLGPMAILWWLAETVHDADVVIG